MRVLKSAIAFVLFSLAFIPSSKASSITYVDTGYGSGTFGGLTFVDKLITIMFSTDTTGIVPNGPGLFVNKLGTGGSVGVEGIGQAELFNAYAYVNQSFNGTAAAGIATTDAFGTVLGTLNNSFSTYALGALSSTVGRSYSRPDLIFSTAFGDFNLESIGETTFTAIANVSPVPLPASLPMFSAALLGLGAVGFGMKRKSKAAASA